MDLEALHEDLYRMGNATSPNFNEERLFIDCRVIHRNGIKVVLANGNGFSAFSYITGTMKQRGKNVEAALRYYRDYLTSIKEPDEEKDLLIYDRLKTWIASFRALKSNWRKALNNPRLRTNDGLRLR